MLAGGSTASGSDFVLRDWRATDADSLVRAWVDIDIARWNAVPADPSLARAQQWIAGVEARRLQGTAVDVVIESDPAVGVVGEIGLSSFNAKHKGALLGYWLLPEARGDGLAGAAVGTFVQWVWSNLDLDVLVARCDPDNVASHSVATAAGLMPAGHDPQQRLLFRVVRPTRAREGVSLLGFESDREGSPVRLQRTGGTPVWANENAEARHPMAGILFPEPRSWTQTKSDEPSAAWLTRFSNEMAVWPTW